MEIALGIVGGLCILEGVALYIILSPWGQKKIVRRLVRLARYGKTEAREILSEVDKVLK